MTMTMTPAATPRGQASPAAVDLLGLVRGAGGPGGLHVPLIGAAVACLGLLGLHFWTTLRHLVYVWSTDDNYSHGFLVPLISLYFANEAAKRGPIPHRGGLGTGAALLALALVGKLATVLVPVGFVADLAFLLGLAGVCALMAGNDALRRFAFPIGFLVFMIPLPVALYAVIASPLQLMVSRIASALMNAVGVPVLCEGNLLTLPGDVRMFVAEACSGMRQLTGFLALTTAVAYLSPRPGWQRVLIVASSVPIAMTANVIRVTITGCIMYLADPKYASGAFHTVEGLALMGLGLALLFAECWTLDLITRLAADARTPGMATS